MKSKKSEMKKSGLRRYFRVSGRAPRSEMWKVILIGSFLQIIAMIVFATLLCGFFPSLADDTAYDIIILISSLLFLPAVIATATRRLHDLNWTGWWLFLVVFQMLILEIGFRIVEISGVFYWWMWIFVPPIVACHLLLIYGYAALLFAKGTKGPNDFGEDPLRK